ncbi:MAG: sigma-70 family RNA polymerase sigma factor [Frankiaceae bacterium]|nr:sigma-70 family RNA polymerase sigma factor [Frankiaceae bacterium]
MTAVTVDPRAPRTDHSSDLGYRDFYARYHRPLLCYLQVAFADADGEAVAQETMCRALKHWSTVGQMQAPWPWLAVTARNLARNNIRDEKGTFAAGLDVFQQSTRSHTDVAAQVDASDQLRRLAKAMEVLTPLQRQLLTVLVEEGLTAAEVARRLGMKPGAARMHLCRMRARLSERFVALGGQLSVMPLAFLHFVVRRPKNRAAAAQHAPIAAGSAVLAWSVSVVAIGIVGIAPAHSTPIRTDASASTVQTSSSSERLATAKPAHRAPVRNDARTATQLPAPAVAYQLTLSSTPTKPGRVAHAGSSVSSPAGRLYAEVPAWIPRPDPGTTCPAGIGC